MTPKNINYNDEINLTITLEKSKAEYFRNIVSHCEIISEEKKDAFTVTFIVAMSFDQQCLKRLIEVIQ